MTVLELKEISGAGLHKCKKAIEYCGAHKDCTPLGYLKACSFAVATPNMTFDERVRSFSLEESEET